MSKILKRYSRHAGDYYIGIPDKGNVEFYYTIVDNSWPITSIDRELYERDSEAIIKNIIEVYEPYVAKLALPKDRQ